MLSLVRCWFFPEPFLVTTCSCRFRTSSSACLFWISSSLCVGGFLFGLVHGSSRYFSCFLFRGFRALPSFSVGLVRLFLLQAVVFHLYAFFLFGFVFPSSWASFWFSLFFFLWVLPWRVCPALGVLAGVSSFGFFSSVSQCCSPPGPSSHGVLCCWLPFQVVSHLALLSGTFGVRVSSSSSFVVSVYGGGGFASSGGPTSLYCSCSPSSLTRVVFLPSRIGGLFLSPRTPSRPLSPAALVSSYGILCRFFFLFVGFFSSPVSSSSSYSLASSFRPCSSGRVSGVLGCRFVLGIPCNSPWSSILGGLSLVFLCLTFFMFVLSSLLFFWLPFIWGPLPAEVAGL